MNLCHRAWRARDVSGVWLASLVVLSSGCSGSDSEAPATWTVRTGHHVGPDTTTFTAMVRRLGCNNGVTGDVHEPRVVLDDSEVVVILSVDPVDGDATCPDNEVVPYEVVLPEPLGDRSLVDGQCGSDTDAGRTSYCEPDGTRYSPS